MALIIDVAPEVERALQNEAARHGQSVAEYTAAVLTEVARGGQPNGPTAKTAQKTQRLLGKYAHVTGSVDDFLAGKRGG